MDETQLDEWDEAERLVEAYYLDTEPGRQALRESVAAYLNVPLDTVIIPEEWWESARRQRA